MPNLLQDFDAYWRGAMIPRALPDFILKSLNPAFQLRRYQEEALARLLYYLEKYGLRISPSQLLFHMATGSGKTLVMAAAMLHLYDKGFRNFLFFVNSTNIIEKTKANFLNPLSPKYQFADKILYDGRAVRIRQVDNFQTSGADDINVAFTTIQGLHTRLNTPREGALTYDDFADRKIVLISDEAHHISTLTKAGKLSKEECEELTSWEATVNKIFKSNADNIMLEFTATVELTHPLVAEKYADKILFDYTLKQFREEGFSKDVQVLQANLEPMERALQALVVSQYRRKVAERNGLQIKPVMLLKSRTIPESDAFAQEFQKTLHALRPERLAEISARGQSDVVQKAFAFFAQNKISLPNLVRELQAEFSAAYCRLVNSAKECEMLQVELNELERPDNEIRAVFVVDMLNEGWDVLNLFDIVRLYETRDAKAGKPGPTTIKEAQLIGRGARYFPFQLAVSQERFKRKYDDEPDSELRVLEELHYHSSSNPRYIRELRQALIQTGIMAERARQIHVRVKDSFKQTDFWQHGHLYLNEKTANTRGDIFGFGDMHLKIGFTYALPTSFARDVQILGEQQLVFEETQTQAYALCSFGVQLVRTALCRNKCYTFDRLRRYFPHLTSVREFIASDKYLGQIQVEVKGHEYDVADLTADNRLKAAGHVLTELALLIENGTAEYRGTKEFKPHAIAAKVKDKELNIVVSSAGDQEYGIGMCETNNPELHLELKNQSWYVYDENYGTSEEKKFVKFVQAAIKTLRRQYEQVYLLRNERLFQLYRFSDGAAVEPDFVLFAIEKKTRRHIVYQIFVETKGKKFRADDQWKEDFLVQIEKTHKLAVLFKNTTYKLIGLPFYTSDQAAPFVKMWHNSLHQPNPATKKNAAQTQ